MGTGDDLGRDEMPKERKPSYHHLPANADTVHWGYFSKLLKPKIEVHSGDFVTIETLTHQASDDAERMIQGDPGAESVYLWTKEKKGVMRRGAGGSPDGGGLGVHICTGPVAVAGAEPGDVLEVRILDVTPRPSANPDFKGLCLRQQRSGELGFSLPGPDHRRQAARGGDDLRGGCHRRAQLGEGGLQLQMDPGHRSDRQGASDDRLSRAAGGSHARPSATGTC